MNKTKVTYMDADSLIPYANNPRLNDNAVYAVAASIKEFGKAIYGSGFLLSENAARDAETAARDAEAANAVRVWELSEREPGIVANLGKNEEE